MLAAIVSIDSYNRSCQHGDPLIMMSLMSATLLVA